MCSPRSDEADIGEFNIRTIAPHAFAHAGIQPRDFGCGADEVSRNESGGR